MRGPLVGSLLLIGCGVTATNAELRDLRARIDTGDRAQADVTRKLEELDNRVFLLTDQVESQKVVLSQRSAMPRLPVVTLAPPIPGPREVVLSAAAPEPEPEPAPPTTIRNDRLPTITLSGGDTPWLDPERAAVEDDRFASERATKGPRARPAASSPVLARRGPRSVSPPAGDGLGITRGKPPFVNQVVGGRAQPVVTPAAPPGGPVPLEAPLAGPDPTALYRAAYTRLKAGQQAAAADDFRAFVARFPQHDLADNAQYWLGESYYARGEFHTAVSEFRTVLQRWPSGNKAPDALLKLGFCMLQQGDAGAGRATLQELVDHYPRTEAATLAQRRLAELPADVKR